MTVPKKESEMNVERLATLETDVLGLQSAVRDLADMLRSGLRDTALSIDAIKTQISSVGKLNWPLVVTCIGVLGGWSGVMLSFVVYFTSMNLTPLKDKVDLLEERRESAIQQERVLSQYEQRMAESDNKHLKELLELRLSNMEGGKKPQGP